MPETPQPDDPGLHIEIDGMRWTVAQAYAQTLGITVEEMYQVFAEMGWMVHTPEDGWIPTVEGSRHIRTLTYDEYLAMTGEEDQRPR